LYRAARDQSRTRVRDRAGGDPAGRTAPTRRRVLRGRCSHPWRGVRAPAADAPAHGQAARNRTGHGGIEVDRVAERKAPENVHAFPRGNQTSCFLAFVNGPCGFFAPVSGPSCFFASGCATPWSFCCTLSSGCSGSFVIAAYSLVGPGNGAARLRRTATSARQGLMQI